MIKQGRICPIVANIFEFKLWCTEDSKLGIETEKNKNHKMNYNILPLDYHR